MYAAISPSEAETRWSDGAARIAVAADHGTTRLRDLYQSDPCRVLFPRPGDGGAYEGVIVTTSGGIVGGDRIAIEIEAGDGCVATITTQAAEKIYRSAGPVSEISVQVKVGANAVLEWMPQGTILFDGARLRRKTSIEAAPGSRLLCGEFIVFGRRARGENFDVGFLHDGWRWTEGGRLIWADALHLADDPGATIARTNNFDGAASYGTMIYRADDAPDCLGKVRNQLSDATGDGCTAGVTCLGALLVVRFLGKDAAATRRSFARFWSAMRAELLGLPARLPRVWEI